MDGPSDETWRSAVPFLLFLLLLLSAMALAYLANRLLGLRIETEIAVESDAERRWLDELAVLRLEERHPCC